MGRKTHGPYLVAAIEYNDLEKVNEIIVKQFRDKKTICNLLVSELHRLASEQTEIPLLLAASLPDPTILRYFVTKHKADINHVFEVGGPKNQRKTTVLLAAVRQSLYDTVSTILALNADTNVADHKGRRPLHYAIRRSVYLFFKFILDDLRGTELRLRMACRTGHATRAPANEFVASRLEIVLAVSRLL
jgi:ankyrin repeat protein